jgi:uncharacterized protein
MRTLHSEFREEEVIHKLKHYLPAQAPLKDFIHHNTLHAFQDLKFHQALRNASEIFGYKVSPSLDEYRQLYKAEKIKDSILEKILGEKKGTAARLWKQKLLNEEYSFSCTPRVGCLRSAWRAKYKMDLDSLVHPALFRILCSYLDQGISIWHFPVNDSGFLSSLKDLEKNSFTSFFKTKRAKKLLQQEDISITFLLKMLVGDESLFEHYLFDQQFAHQGWSGMVSVIEDNPSTLLDTKKISLQDLIFIELLLEIDSLDHRIGEKKWEPLHTHLSQKPEPFFAEVPVTETSEVMELWQEAYEWSYYDDVLATLRIQSSQPPPFETERSLQAFFCIDDRECSLRRYIELSDPSSETFSTPGFFNVEFFYKPMEGKFYTKLCPAPMNPKYLIKEIGAKRRGRREKEVHFSEHSHSLIRGSIIAYTLGFWSACKLFINIFRPSMSPATASSFKHMDKFSELTITNKGPEQKEGGLQVGFTIEEMTTRVEGLLKSTGLLKNFAPLIYMIGHGSSSVNNPHFAAYDCGACSGRPGSVNARVFCHMANDPAVREKLAERGIVIPEQTQFVGGLHDTTRDEIVFYDEKYLSPQNAAQHKRNEITFRKALDLNAKERSRRFDSINTKQSAEKIHKKILTRSVSLFEPRPELNHATNTLCIVGRRQLTKDIFLDRRSFMNSYDYETDLEGKYLLNILNAAAPVCGGINLEYFFSRVDNQKLGAGTKLPHNVMGLFGVANGIDGDLRPGLPSQMIELHEPLRLMTIVEHFPNVVLDVIKKNPATYQWFENDWVHLVVIHPTTKELLVFANGKFRHYVPAQTHIKKINNLNSLLENSKEGIPPLILK